MNIQNLVIDYMISKSYNTHAEPKTGYIFSVIGFFLLFSIAVGVLITPILILTTKDMDYAYYASIIVQGFALFLLPAWLVEKYYRYKHFDWVYRLKWSDTTRANRLLPILIFVLSIPIAETLGWIMEQIPIPDALSFIQEAENATTEIYEKMMLERRPIAIILIAIGISIAAPLGEEILFRGSFMGWGLTKTRNKHLVVWVIAIVFSLFHFQWSGFLGRVFLGALMGYLALYGGLWSAIIFHFVNNTTYHLIGLTWGTEDLFDSQNTTQVIILMIVAVAASVGIWKLIKSIKQSSQDATAIESIDYE